jgi:hypothetical protein
MRLDGLEVDKLGSPRDRLRCVAFFKRQQTKIFETLVGVYSQAMTVNPDLSKKVEPLITDYIDSIVPGSKKIKKEQENNTIARNKAALDAIYKKIKENNTKASS